MRFFSTILLSSLLIFSINSSAATIYKWVDAQGNQHFGSQPPAQLPSEKITVKTGIQPAIQPTQAPDTADDSGASIPSQADLDKQARQQTAKEQAQLKQRCLDLRTRLAQLKSNPRILAEVEGQTVRLTEEQRQEYIRDTQEQLAEDCQDF